MKSFAIALITLSTFSAFAKDIAADTVLGIVTLGKGFENDTVKVYNADGSLWVWHSLDGINHGQGANDFRPYTDYPDYFVLCLRVVSIKGNHYEIIANEETGLKKYAILDKRSKLTFVGTQAYLKNNTIGFDWNTNPLRKAIAGAPIDFDRSLFRTEIITFKGDWAKVKICDDDKHCVEGWVRWRKGNEMFVKIYKD
ncbi:MAG: hypothetical protein WDO15_15820 [Bacteroidota bacterium]